MIGPRWMIGHPSESAPRPAERPADAPVQGVARSHGKPAASGRISAPSDGREWMLSYIRDTNADPLIY